MAGDETAVEKTIPKAIAILRKSQHLSDEQVHRELTQEGIDPSVAARLLEFLPIAYARLILGRSGAKFSNSFQRLRPDGCLVEQALSTEPFWTAAIRFAQSEVVQGVAASELLAIAARSAELHAANQLLNKGSTLENVVFNPPVLTWPEEGPSATSS
jgi:hypothetical protein